MSILIDTIAAQKHFSHVDPTMAVLFDEAFSHVRPAIVPIAKAPHQYFASIVSSIISQQISIHAADAVHQRVKELLGTITPDTATAASEADLRSCGLSRQKISYIQKSATIWPSLHTAAWPTMSDEEVITELTQLYGIGRWTAEMFLIFSLARPDVFSRGDIGLMNGLFQCYPHLKPHYTRKLDALIGSWSPHRTTAALTLWWHKDGGPLLL